MLVEVSIGEVVDKVTILSIKLEKFKDAQKKMNVQKEYDTLIKDINKLGIDENSPEFQELRAVNVKLWNIEDSIRVKEFNKEFDEEFIQIARSVYFENDTRAEIKKKINLKFGSSLIEEKEYVEYKGQ